MDPFDRIFATALSEEEAHKKLEGFKKNMLQNPDFLSKAPEEQKSMLAEFDQRRIQAAADWQQNNGTPDEFGAPRSLGGLSQAGKIFWDSPSFREKTPDERVDIAGKLVDKMVERGEVPPEKAEKLRARAQFEATVFTEQEGIVQHPGIDPISIVDAGAGAGIIGKMVFKHTVGEAAKRALAGAAGWAVAGLPVGMAVEKTVEDSDYRLPVELGLSMLGGMAVAPLEMALVKGMNAAPKAIASIGKTAPTKAMSSFDSALDRTDLNIEQAFSKLGMQVTEEIPPTIVPSVESLAPAKKMAEIVTEQVEKLPEPTAPAALEAPTVKPSQPAPAMEQLPGSDISVQKMDKVYFGWNNPTAEERALGKSLTKTTKAIEQRQPGTPELFHAPGAGKSLGIRAEDAYKMNSAAVKAMEERGYVQIRGGNGADYFHINDVENSLKEIRLGVTPGMDKSLLPKLLDEMKAVELLRANFRPKIGGSPYERSQTLVKELGLSLRPAQRLQEMIEKGLSNEDIARKMMGWPSVRKAGFTQDKLLAQMENVLPTPEGLAKSLTKQFGLSAQAERGFAQAFSSMSRRLKTPITVDPDMESFGRYFFAQDKIYLKDPKAIFHEIGHWAFDNILSIEDRIAYFDLLGSKYNSPKSWDRIFPFRKAFRAENEAKLAAGELDQEAFNRYDAWMNSPNEAFADMVSKYTNGHVIPTEDFISIVDKAKIAAEEWIRKRFGRTTLPGDLEKIVGKVYKNRIVDGVSVPTIKDRENAFASLESSWRFIDKDVFLDSIKQAADFEGTGVFPKADDYLVTKIKELPPLDPTKIKSFSDVVGQGKLSPDQLLENIQLHTHLWYHGVEPDSLPVLDDLMQRVIHFAEPHRREEITAELRKAFGKVVESPYGRVQNAPDGVVLSEKELARAQSKAIQTSVENNAHLDSGADMAYKAFVADLTEQYRVFEAMKLERMNGDIPSVPPQLRDALIAERMFRFNEGSFYDDLGRVSTVVLQSTLGRYLPSLSTLALGLNMDDEDGVYIPGVGYLGWSPTMYATRFGGIGPVVAAYMLPGNKALAAEMLAKVRDKATTKLMESGSTFEKFGVAMQRMKNSYFAKSFHPTEGLPEELYGIKRQMNISQHDYARRGAKLASDLVKQHSHEDRVKIAEILTKEGNYQNYSEALKAKAGEIRDFHSKVRELLEASGIPKEVLEKVDADAYLHRHYTNLGKTVEPEIKKLVQAYKTIGADYLLPRGTVLPIRKGQSAFNELQSMAGEGGIKPGMKVYDFGAGDDRFFVLPTQDRPLSFWTDQHSPHNHEWVVEKIQKNKFVLRRDYTKQERRDLGEVMDVAPRIAIFARNVSRDLAVGNAYKKLSEVTEHVKIPSSLSAEEKLELMDKGWKLVKDTTVGGTPVKKYGMLAGRLVSPEVDELLSGMGIFKFESQTANDLFSKWKTLTQAFKIGKTAFNIATHGVNFMSNAALTALDGRNPISVIYNGLKHSYDKSDWYMQAVDRGMIDSSLLRADFNLDSFMRGLDGISGSHFNQSKSVLSRMVDQTFKGLKKAARVPMYVYEKGDQIYKMGVFAEEMAKHGDPDAAIKAANRLFFDYRDIPRGVQFLRDSGIMPFVSYSYKAAPLMFDIARENPHRLLGMLAMFKLMNDFSFNAEYEDWKKGLDYEKAVMPQYMKDRKIFGLQGGLARIPGGSGESPYGQRFSRYFDFGRFVPGGDALNPLQMLSQYPFGFHPLISTVMGVINNQDPYFGKAISKVREQGMQTIEDKIQYAKDLSRFVINVWAPNVPFLNPVSYATEDMCNMLTRYGVIPEDVANKAGWTGTDKYGTPATAAETLLGVFGARVRRLYPDEEMVMQMKKIKWGLNTKQNEIKTMARDARTSEAELARAMAGFEKSASEASGQLGRLGDLQSAAIVRAPGISH